MGYYEEDSEAEDFEEEEEIGLKIIQKGPNKNNHEHLGTLYHYLTLRNILT